MRQRQVWVQRITALELADGATLRVSRILLDVQVQFPGADVVGFWFEVQPGEELTDRRFQAYGSGHDIPPTAEYWGTLLLRGGSLVLHVYEHPVTA